MHIVIPRSTTKNIFNAVKKRTAKVKSEIKKYLFNRKEKSIKKDKTEPKQQKSRCKSNHNYTNSKCEHIKHLIHKTPAIKD